jgi:putative polyhydroxyalkanoate system protein
MATKTIERTYPGKKADEIYAEVEKVLRRMGEKYGISCQFDPATRRIVVPEKMGVQGLCTIEDGRARIELSHGLMGTAVIGTVKGYIEDKLDKLFA